MGGFRDGSGGSKNDDQSIDRQPGGEPETSPPGDEPSVDEVIQESDHQAAARRTEEEEIFPAYGDDEEQGNRLNPVQRFLGQRDIVPERDKQTVRIEIPSKTIVKVILTLVIIWLVLKVASIFLLLLLAIIVCLALLPVVRRLENRGLPRGLAVVTVISGLVGIIAGFLWLIVPPLVTQTQNLIDNAPEYVENFDDILDRYPSIRDQVDTYLGIGDEDAEQSPAESAQDTGSEEDPAPAVDAGTVQAGATQVLSVSTAIVGGIANVFFVLVLALYLLVEGERTWRYFARYMTPTLRYRFHRLGPQLTQVVSGYVIGQAIISTTFGVFSYIVLFVLNVPQPLLLSLFGAVAVAIPIVGVPVATIAVMAIALSVSWQTSLIVFGVFMLYQQFENYVLLPRVYGNTLQVTSLSILVGVLVGGQLLGILGIILSLPLTASIPVIERVWREQVPDDIEALEEATVTREPTPTEIVRGDRS
ncbi:MAG: AI-2E family transporter [Chloroflexia bacterium]|nr:AI-2E family transporter [Chloroflexia bacterium]MBA2469779.1 AI-2E family transporter [Chloroflexia bacterium]